MTWGEDWKNSSKLAATKEAFFENMTWPAQEIYDVVRRFRVVNAFCLLVNYENIYS